MTRTGRKRLLSSVFGAASLAMCAAAAHAQEADQDTSMADENISSVDEIIVTGRAQRLYRVGETDTGKLPTDPLSAAQVITSINEQLIRDQGARDAQDIYRNISGVTQFSYGGVTARGFRQEEIFFDGLRGSPYVGFNVPQLFNVERVDFLKGPAGMLYGPGAPGGLFNYVTKKPQEEFSARATGIYGTEARYGGSFEITGALPLEGTAGRVGVFFEDRNTPRKNSANEVLIYDAGFSAELGFAKLVLQGTRYEQYQQGNRLRGVPVDDEGNFLADRRWNHNERSDFLNLISNNFQARLDGEIGETLAWNAAIRYTDSEQSQEYHEPFILLDAAGGTDGPPAFVARQFRDQFREEEQLTLGVNAIWTDSFGPVDNRLLVGVEFFNGELAFNNGGLSPTGDMIDRFFAGESLASDIIPLSLTAPQYGLTRPEDYNVLFLPESLSEQQRLGGYVLNEATIGQFTAVAGVRFDRFEDVLGDTSFVDERATFRFGLVYKPRDDVSLFGQWAQSYQPQSVFSQRPESGGPFDPTEGTIVEGGVKTALFNGRVQTTLAGYQIKRTNILQLDEANDPFPDDGVDFLIAFGEVTSRGVEFDISTDITPDWVLTTSYGFNDTRVTEDNGSGDSIGNAGADQFANAPRNQLGFWTRYQIPEIDLAIAFGGDYVSERLSFDEQRVRPYAVFDASIIWTPDLGGKVGPIQVLLRGDNLFDKTFAASGFGRRTGHFPGDPRSVFVEISKEW